MTRNERGAAAVEFALVVPLLVLLVMGIAELGRAYYVQTTISAAAREGARVMALRNDTGQATTAVRTAAGPLVLSDIAVAPVSGTCVSTATSQPNATVTIRYSFTFATSLIGAPFTLVGKGVMRCGG